MESMFTSDHGGSCGKWNLLTPASGAENRGCIMFIDARFIKNVSGSGKNAFSIAGAEY
jgi:hypothetical protein